MRWECRYSSSEMMYLEVTEAEVRCFLDHSPDSASRWTFDEVLAGALERDAEVRILFSDQVLGELKAAVRERRDCHRGR